MIEHRSGDRGSIMRRTAARAFEPVVDEPCGMREFAVTDPSGNRLRVGRNL